VTSTPAPKSTKPTPGHMYSPCLPIHPGIMAYTSDKAVMILHSLGSVPISPHSRLQVDSASRSDGAAGAVECMATTAA
jgi:5,10-methylenetetrahydrofolate reductase